MFGLRGLLRPSSSHLKSQSYQVCLLKASRLAAVTAESSCSFSTGGSSSTRDVVLCMGCLCLIRVRRATCWPAAHDSGNPQALQRSLEALSDAYHAWTAVRAAKFVARKQWVVCGADDMFIRVYNYNTMDKIKHFEAHTDYIRSAPATPPPALCRTP